MLVGASRADVGGVMAGSMGTRSGAGQPSGARPGDAQSSASVISSPPMMTAERL